MHSTDPLTLGHYLQGHRSHVHGHRQVVSHAHQPVRHISNHVLIQVGRRARRIRVLPLPIHVRQLKGSSHTIFSVPSRSRLHFNSTVHPHSTFSRTVTNVRVHTAHRQQVHLSHSVIHLTVHRRLTLLPHKVRFSLISNQVFTHFLVRPLGVLQRRVTRTRQPRTALHTRLIRHLPHFTKAPVRQNKPVRRVRIRVVRLRRTGLAIRHLTYKVMPLFQVTRLHHRPRILTVLALHRTHILRHASSTDLIVMPHDTVSVTVANFRHTLSRKNGTLIISTRRTRTSLQGRVTIKGHSRQDIRGDRKAAP